MPTTAKPFNVTLIWPASFVHALALKEAADYVHATLLALGYTSARTVNHVSTDAYNIIFCAHLLHLLESGQVRGLPADTIIFNSEQLEDVGGDHFQAGFYQDFLRRFFVWDYSLQNLPRIPHGDKCLIPFLYFAPLQRADVRRKRGLKLLFYGSLNPRREALLVALKRAGVPLEVLVDAYEMRRDVKLLRAWAVLNLHKSDATSAFEPIRCSYALTQGVPVISEEVSDPTAEPFRDSMIFLPPEQLIAGIAALHAAPADFAAHVAPMLAAFRRKSPLPAVAAAVTQFLSRWG